jgi:hypothetical protein
MLEGACMCTYIYIYIYIYEYGFFLFYFFYANMNMDFTIAGKWTTVNGGHQMRVMPRLYKSIVLPIVES